MIRTIPARVVTSPVGDLLIAVGDTGVRALEILGTRTVDEARQSLSRSLGGPVIEDTHALLRRTTRELDDFFHGKRRFFTLPLAVQGTPFQRQVWEALVRIPHGETLAYAELAEMLGRPTAARAVANACARNPLPIIIPCHRVIGSDGDLGGFAAGLTAKRTLLNLERKDIRSLPLFQALASAKPAPPPVSGDLPAHLRDWLTADHRDDPAGRDQPLSVDAWLCEVMALVPVHHWPRLAEQVATTDGPDAEALTIELLEAYAAEIRNRWPSPGGLGRFLRLAAARDLHAFERTTRHLVRAPGRPHAVTAALVEACVALMSGDTACGTRSRELAVDVWLALDPNAAAQLAQLARVSTRPEPLDEVPGRNLGE